MGVRTVLALGAALLVAACARSNVLLEPSPAFLAAQAPDSFVVEVVTSEGPFEVALYRAWSPLAVDRAYLLFDNDFYAGARIYRVAEGFVAQWGFSGQPALDSVWRTLRLPDEPVVESNLRGVVSFARAGPESRSYTLFVNLTDNVRLDTATVSGIVGYPPIGRIVKGLEVIDGFYAAYKEPPPRQDSIGALGNDYLRRSFPQLDSIVGTRVIRVWP